jgi:hypothetical protein
MKQFYKEYFYWEDYLNGMYEIPKKQDEEMYTKLALELLSNTDSFLITCKHVVSNWVISTKVNLTNTNCNRKAWLGQAACNYKYKVPETCTRLELSKLSIEQQYKANSIADRIILEYERKNNRVHKNMGTEVLF